MAELPPGQRDTYIRDLSSSEGLVAVAGAVVRTVTPMLRELSAAEQSAILRLGEVERAVLWQAAVADEWRIRNPPPIDGADTSAQAGPGGAGPTVPPIPPQPAPTGDQEMGEAGGPSVPVAPASVRSATAAAGADGGVGGPDHAAGAAVSGSGKRKRSPEELACEILAHCGHTARSFYQSVAKAIHVRSRREEAAPPTTTMRVAALHLALVLRKNFEFEVGR